MWFWLLQSQSTLVLSQVWIQGRWYALLRQEPLYAAQTGRRGGMVYWLFKETKLHRIELLRSGASGQQIEGMINKKYTFYNMDGLNEKKLAMVKDRVLMIRYW